MSDQANCEFCGTTIRTTMGDGSVRRFVAHDDAFCKATMSERIHYLKRALAASAADAAEVRAISQIRRNRIADLESTIVTDAHGHGRASGPIRIWAQVADKFTIPAEAAVDPGTLVCVYLPDNCSLHSLDALMTSRILDIGRRLGAWARDNTDANHVVLSALDMIRELGALTAPRDDAGFL